jgi:hypothetical protein
MFYTENQERLLSCHEPRYITSQVVSDRLASEGLTN